MMDNLMVANACMHCVDPVCMIGCPTGAIHRTSHGGEVVINPASCIGCTICAQKCPANAIPLIPYQQHEIFQDSCIKCGTCRQVCPTEAVEVS